MSIQDRIKTAEQSLTILEKLSSAQLRLVRDPGRTRVAICGRRAGKSYSAAAILILTALAKPGTRALYIAISRGHASRIMWAAVIMLLTIAGISFTPKIADLEITLSNGSVIWLTGCPDSAHVEVFRGPKYSVAIIDEAASFPRWIKVLVQDVLRPALMDHRGSLVLLGTPGVSPVGLFHDISVGNAMKNVPIYRWTVFDNPAIPHAREELDATLEENGWDESHPTIQREWFGKDVLDRSMLVYGDYHRSMLIDALPEGDWLFFLGIDIGSNEKQRTTAFTIIAASRARKQQIVIESRAFAGMIPMTLATEIKRWRAKYSPTKIVMDAGALGSGYVREMQRVHGISVQPAEKKDKLSWIDQINGQMQIGGMQFISRSTKDLRAEIEVLPWHNEDRDEEKDGMANHCCDSWLYAWRESRRFVFSVKAPKRELSGAERSKLRMIDNMKKAANKKRSGV